MEIAGPKASTAPAEEIAPVLPARRRRIVRAFRKWLNRAAADFWMNFFFWHARRQPWFAEWSKPFWLWFAWRFSDHLYGGLMANAGRILGPSSTREQQEDLAWRTMSSFYDFVADVGHAMGLSRQQLLNRIDSVQGKENYLSARESKKGAIIVTAHMGSFEVGVASLLDQEKKIHVLFHPDQRNLFEDIRSTLRKKLGVVEVPIDQGWTVWMRLRDALAANEAVLIQGDRILPGQKGQAVPFFGGHTLLPTGPVKLAMATGAPIIPVFSIRTRRGKVRIFIEPAIWVEPDAPMPALLKLGQIIEKYIRCFPDQWLANQPAWIEDAGKPMLPPPIVVKMRRVKAMLSTARPSA